VIRSPHIPITRRPLPARDRSSKPLLPERFQLLVECPNEAAQKQLYEALAAQGFVCRVLTI
jgi:hypothetical protein